MPTPEHEAPIAILREQPALLPALLREALDVEVPESATVEVADADFTQVLPVERRADLVTYLRVGAPELPPVMGVIVEVQRTRDDDKRRSWPLYAAALHARLESQICLLVIATDEATARWAAKPITTLQVRSPFVPLVLGPSRIPRVSVERARYEPWLAVLAATAHGKDEDRDALRALLVALDVLPEASASFCYDVLYGVLDDAAHHFLETKMHPDKYQRIIELAPYSFRAGREEGRQAGELAGARSIVLALVDRHGPVTDDLRSRIETCAEPDRLRGLAIEIAAANDRASIERLLAALPAGQGS